MKKLITLIIGAVIILGGMHYAEKKLYTEGSLQCWGLYDRKCKNDTHK